ncbi:MAG: flagellar hook capping protein [Lachnospiraceae bacterium]|nr:flagellar hook capping protein [Lachnospiraceae bacterium]
MAVSALINDGKITNLGNEETVSKKKSNDTVDKEQFLQLLVAQMKYQDPLEPTDNTQYVSQLAQFSELEQMQNVAKTSEMTRANSLVGELVTISKTDATTGAVTEETGKVDYVLQQGKNIMLSVNDNLFSLDDLDQVWDANYADATALANEWKTSFDSLPAVNDITAQNVNTAAEFVQKLYDTYNDMTVYQKTFLPSDIDTSIKEYIDMLAKYGYQVTTEGLQKPEAVTEAAASAVEEEADETQETVQAAEEAGL